MALNLKDSFILSNEIFAQNTLFYIQKFFQNFHSLNNKFTANSTIG